MKPTGLLLDEVRDTLQKLSGRQLTDLAARVGVSRATLYILRRGERGRSVRLYTLEALQRGLEEGRKEHARIFATRRKKENQGTTKSSEVVEEEGALLNEVCGALRKLKGRQLTEIAAQAGVGRSTAYMLRQGERGREVRVHTLEALKIAMKAERTA